jgi:exonuclease SbcD
MDDNSTKPLPMKFLHTADWHIGQLFYDYDRTWEHEQFLNWLVTTLQTEQIDVLLVSGDVFDLSNPSAASVKLFYSFLRRAITVNPELQIIITAGNHDSATRLEAPKPLLESTNIHIIGVIDRSQEGTIDYEKLMVALKDKSGEIVAWCLAVPFLRMGDYPAIDGSENPYAEGVGLVYADGYNAVLAKKKSHHAVIALGHLHSQQATVGEMDKQERQIMGGIECVAANAFHEDIHYVALGHIHRAQTVGGKQHIRYSGSPLPMSFSEIHYRHQVVVFELNCGQISDPKGIEVPVTVPLLRVPGTNSTLPEVLIALGQLPSATSTREPWPYLEVRLLADGPEPAMRYKIDGVLKGKAVRLAKIDLQYPNALKADGTEDPLTVELAELNPFDVFAKAYRSKYERELPEQLAKLFKEIAAEAAETE